MAWRCYLGKDRFLEDPLSLIRQYQPKHCLPELCGGGGGWGVSALLWSFLVLGSLWEPPSGDT